MPFSSPVSAPIRHRGFRSFCGNRKIRTIRSFALAPLSETEKESIATFNGLLNSIEKFVRKVYQHDKAEHLQKAVFHSDLSPEKLDFIIHSLQKIRRTILTGEGVKKALKEKAA